MSSTSLGDFAIFLIGVSVGLFIALFIAIFGAGLDYKHGQIDAVTGNMKYERVTQSDSTVIWEKKK